MDIFDVLRETASMVDHMRDSTSIRVYVNGAELRNYDNTFPLLKPVPNTEKFTLLPQASVDTQVWRLYVRGDYGTTNASQVTSKALWQISWNKGQTKINQNVVSISRDSCDLGWYVVLEQGNAA